LRKKAIEQYITGTIGHKKIVTGTKDKKNLLGLGPEKVENH
jgi:hypothetical protein